MRIVAGLICLLLLLPLSSDAQVKKRALRPISFKIINIEPTTVITYEPFKVTYRLEYLRPQGGKEVKILGNLDKNHFQNELGTPVDLDFETAKNELVPKIGEAVFNNLKFDTGPRIIVSDFQDGKEEIIGDKVRRDFILTLRFIREKTTIHPFPVIRLESKDVSVSWAEAKLGQKEGEYDNEDPIKSGKFRFNHALTIPTHDPNLNFKSRVSVSQYSSSFWFFWGIPTLSFLFVGLLARKAVKLLKEPVRTVEEKTTSAVGGARTGETAGVKRMKFEYARTKLWKAAVAAIKNKDIESKNFFIGELYGSLNDLLLAALPSASMGSLPADFIRMLEGKNKSLFRQVKKDDPLYVLAGLADKLKPFYEALGDESEKKKSNSDGDDQDISSLINDIRIQTGRLWWYDRFLVIEKRK